MQSSRGKKKRSELAKVRKYDVIESFRHIYCSALANAPAGVLGAYLSRTFTGSIMERRVLQPIPFIHKSNPLMVGDGKILKLDDVKAIQAVF